MIKAKINKTYNNEELIEIGMKFKKADVRCVFFAHGTFAGDSPLGVAEALESTFSEIQGIESLKPAIKKSVDHTMKDLGNYTQGYIDEFANLLGQDIQCLPFIWTSENHHAARLKATVKLAKELAEIIKNKNITHNQRILLCGHSHAGQVFALLTLLLENSVTAEKLLEVIEQLALDKAQLLKDLMMVKTVFLDIVTFGTPVRYAWGQYANYRLLDIINHRSAIDIGGLLTTRDGDYVQQWGAEGTDIITAEPYSSINRQLDVILNDKGRSLTAIKNNFKRKICTQPCYEDGRIVGCEHLLIDYLDNDLSPNWFEKYFDVSHSIGTLFGHGAYTRIDFMQFTGVLLAKSLYS